ncbi:hypothetical protein GCM10022254_54570 [Actinomadura meridiana]|uniref:Uncharacterized protein n=1 Tax=Actinomadura meridiana TaxID=559626 RepID=A0ABP8CF31_9ACTN
MNVLTRNAQTTNRKPTADASDQASPHTLTRLKRSAPGHQHTPQPGPLTSKTGVSWISATHHNLNTP